jgi:CRISPR-associated protein Cmr4
MNEPNPTPHSALRSPHSRILYLFTRTPLHVGAGASVGAIDQPIIRERHTGFPVIPASSLKGTFADAWNDDAMRFRQFKRVLKKEDGTWDDETVAAWLFGSDEANHAFAGALQFSEAKLLAFPIRSAKGSFAWITCPLMLARAARDGVPGIKAIDETQLKCFSGPDGDSKAFFGGNGLLALKVKDGTAEKTQVVLEEYTFTHTRELPDGLSTTLQNLLADEVWKEVTSRLVILSDGMMSFFAQNACEVAQHVRISDETGTAAGGALFNQENVPSEALFYAVLHAFDERTANKPTDQRRKAEVALEAFKNVADGKVFQFGGDASTGLGYCTVAFDKKGA